MTVDYGERWRIRRFVCKVSRGVFVVSLFLGAFVQIGWDSYPLNLPQCICTPNFNTGICCDKNKKDRFLGPCPAHVFERGLLSRVLSPSWRRGKEMVVIELEPEPKPEPEQVKHPSPPAPEEAAAPETSWEEAARPLSPPAPEEQSAAGAGREAPRVEEEEDAFEDALTDEQLREVGRVRPLNPHFPLLHLQPPCSNLYFSLLTA